MLLIRDQRPPTQQARFFDLHWLCTQVDDVDADADGNDVTHADDVDGDGDDVDVTNADDGGGAAIYHDS